MEISPEHRRVLSGEAQGAGAACLRALLRGLSLMYALAVYVRNFLYDKGLRRERRVDKPVISIGNITTGGTGKTPAVEHVVRWLLKRGARPAILSRGYRSKGGRNDEALVLAAHLPDVPHRQQPGRFRAAVEAIQRDNANVLVLDDGFQHRRLARFADIVLIDATCPFGYGYLLPRGLLREAARNIRRADAIIVTRCDLVDDAALAGLMDRLDALAPEVPKATSTHRPAAVGAYPNGEPRDPAALAGRRVGLFSSIGNPKAFRQTVEQLGATVAWSTEFPDHHWYTRDDVADILRAGDAAEAFVTTEKDGVKLDGLWPQDRALMILRVEMEILSGEDELNKLLEEALQAAKYGEEEEKEE